MSSDPRMQTYSVQHFPGNLLYWFHNEKYHLSNYSQSSWQGCNGCPRSKSIPIQYLMIWGWGGSVREQCRQVMVIVINISNITTRRHQNISHHLHHSLSILSIIKQIPTFFSTLGKVRFWPSSTCIKFPTAAYSPNASQSGLANLAILLYQIQSISRHSRYSHSWGQSLYVTFHRAQHVPSIMKTFRYISWLVPNFSPFTILPFIWTHMKVLSSLFSHR